MLPPCRWCSLLCLIVCVAALPGLALASGEDWKPINPADLALKEPVVQKDADAEVLLWEARVLDEFQENIETIYPVL